MTDWLKKAASTVVGGAIVAGAVSLLWPSRASAENPGGPPRHEVWGPDERQQNERRLRIQRTGMLTLLAWSAGNIGIGAAGWASTDGEAMYFHQMNVFWNGVNALIGGLGYAQAANEDPRGLGALETVEKTRSIQQILALNTGLDAAYVAGGAWLRQRGDHRDDPQLVGYGNSVMLQGAFLFVFDAVLWAVHQNAINDYKAELRAGAGGRPGATFSVDF